MEQESTSFWGDIKKYEDMLARDPHSYCFAPLAEIYRKLGLLDDAITVAVKGCEIHPDYVGGFMALGRAYYEKGLKEESKAALERVVRGTPDNLLAQKLLCHIYMEHGDSDSARKSLQDILSLNPDDLESQVLLESLKLDGGGALPSGYEFSDEPDSSLAPGGDDLTAEVMSEDDWFLDEAEVIEEIDDAVEEDGDEYFAVPDHAAEITISSEKRDPLRTVTLAELYVSQGLLGPALDIYSELLEAEPDNPEYGKRYAELRATTAEAADAAENVLQEGAFAEMEMQQAVVATTPTNVSAESELASPGTDAVTVISTLEKWLENIKRRR
jgi:tetratricopeptide (TPR) repeat protein